MLELVLILLAGLVGGALAVMAIIVLWLGHLRRQRELDRQEMADLERAIALAGLPHQE